MEKIKHCTLRFTSRRRGRRIAVRVAVGLAGSAIVFLAMGFAWYMLLGMIG